MTPEQINKVYEDAAKEIGDPDPVEYEVWDKRPEEQEDPFSDPVKPAVGQEPLHGYDDTIQTSNQSDKWEVPVLYATASPIQTAEVVYLEMKKLYQEYEEAIGRLAMEEDRAAGEKAAIEIARVRIIANTDPKELGSNEDQRKANISIRLAEATAQYAPRLRSVELLKSELEIARIRVRMSDNTLRFCELTAWRDNEDEGDNR